MKWKRILLCLCSLSLSLYYAGSLLKNKTYALDMKQNIHFGYFKEINLSSTYGTISNFGGTDTGFSYFRYTPNPSNPFDQIRKVTGQFWKSVNVNKGDIFDLTLSISMTNNDVPLASCPISELGTYSFDECNLTTGSTSQDIFFNDTNGNINNTVWNVANYRIIGHFNESTSLNSFVIGIAPLSFYVSTSTLIGVRLSDISIYNLEISSIEGAIKDGNNQAHEDAEAQLNYEKEQNQETEDKANESLNNDGDAAKIDTSSGQNALNVFANIAKTTGGTNCTIGPINAYGFDMGTLNLCHYSPPEWVQTAFAAVTGLALTWTSFLLTRRVVDLTVRAYK